jgi:transcriptional regulator with XRE-family HTH domain
MTTFSKNLSIAIRENGWTVAEFASRANLSRGTVSKYLNGLMAPTHNRLPKIAGVLGVKPADLFKEFEIQKHIGTIDVSGNQILAEITLSRMENGITPEIVSKLNDLIEKAMKKHWQGESLGNIHSSYGVNTRGEKSFAAAVVFKGDFVGAFEIKNNS